MTVIHSNVVHESEAQRQHVRVRLPATLSFPKVKEPIKVLELSAGGVSFEKGTLGMSKGSTETCLLQFNLEGMLVGLQVKIQVRNIDSANGRVGCVFHDLGPQEINTLRQVITSYLAGELITAGDMIQTLQRDNFTKSRKNTQSAQQETFMRKARAFVGSAFVFVLGITAFFFVSSTIYNLYFVTKAKSAFVDSISMIVTMPREGTIQSLVPADGHVQKGAPIATFTSTMLEILKGHFSAESLQNEQIERLISSSLKGTVTSPCDCRVTQQLIADGQIATKGANIFVLVPIVDQHPLIKARFNYNAFSKLQPEGTVTLTIAGDRLQKTGKIKTVAINPEHEDEIIVEIEPDAAINASFSHRPVEVSIGTPINLHLFDRFRSSAHPEA